MQQTAQGLRWMTVERTIAMREFSQTKHVESAIVTGRMFRFHHALQER